MAELKWAGFARPAGAASSAGHGARWVNRIQLKLGLLGLPLTRLDRQADRLVADCRRRGLNLPKAT